MTTLYTHRRFVQPTAAALDVVAGAWVDWWSAWAAILSRARWAWATTSSATCWQPSGPRRGGSADRRESHHLGRRAGLGHFGRRAGAIDDDRRGAGLCARAVLPGGDLRLWALVCMAATLGGTMRAPLMAVVFAFGLTHDANAFLPVLLGCAVAYGFTVILMPRSILTEKIARRGHHIYREYGVDPMEQGFVEDVMTRNVTAIPADMAISEALTTFFGAGQTQRAYPVVQDSRFLGMVDRSPFQHVDAKASAKPVATLVADQVPEFALPNENCRSVASRMAAFGLQRMAVIESPESHRLLGIVSRSDLLKPVKHLHEEESRRQRFSFGSPDSDDD